MILGFDYSTGPPSGKAVADAGGKFVCRYVSWSGNPKNITPEELADMHAHGVAVVLIFETTAERAAAGNWAGFRDAAVARNQAVALGWPDTRPIYFAVDFDAKPSQVWDYFAGINSVLPWRRIGVYGSYDIVKWALDYRMAGYTWQTSAWSRGLVEPRINLFQRLGTVHVDGVECDENEAYTSDYGQWPYQEDDMTPEQAQQLSEVHREATQALPSRVPGSTYTDTAAGYAVNADHYGYEILSGLVNISTQLDRIATKLGA